MDCPRIVIAGTQSGVGKTSLTLAIVTALRRRGYKVQTIQGGTGFPGPHIPFHGLGKALL
ncbi:MAG TPA: DUF1611 domain-containing protein [Syntrophales bacterium]|nr:DUF1611 domain-containing protein [Syntrophales bacterium]